MYKTTDIEALNQLREWNKAGNNPVAEGYEKYLFNNLNKFAEFLGVPVNRYLRSHILEIDYVVKMSDEEFERLINSYQQDGK